MEFQGSFKSKLPQVKTTIFTIMSALAREHGAINLSQGFPDFTCHPDLTAFVDAAMKQGLNQYAPMQGLQSLREQIAAKTEELYTAVYNPEDEITITAGATQAIYTAITALVGYGDEVIIFEPAYDCYAPAVELAGGICKFVQLNPADYSVNWDAVRKILSKNTRMILINTPHNPTGSILSASDMLKLQKLVKGSDVIILSDEVYEHILFDGYEHQSVARYPQLAERSIIVSSFGKTYHTTGWKLGYVMAPKNLMAEFRKVHQYNVFSVNTPVQHAYAQILSNKDLYLGLPAFYQEKRDYFNSLIKGSSWSVTPSSGTYFQNLGYAKISDENDVEFARKLTIEHKVASIPLSVFYKNPVNHHMLRFCFAKENETLEKAAEILHRL
jgi:methionine aminotransferase